MAELQPVRTRDETIASLLGSAKELRGLGVVSLYLFGSAARGDLRNDSDVDLFIDYDPDSEFSFVELVRARALLRDRLAREVDLTTRAGLHPRLKTEIELSSIKVF